MGKAKSIMIQGTGSGVGKSIIVAGLCRIFKDIGIKVAPFKAQNMALNSFVTKNGFEMGRAQVFQALASGLEPDVRMNPILLKPSADNLSQIIVMGKPKANSNAYNYYKMFNENLKIVRDAYDSLANDFDLIIIEGAGSPAEINLQSRDLVNMMMAEYAEASVIIVGDIDRGGVFAWMKGTFDLIQHKYKPLIKGFIINKFRGDIELLKPGIKSFEDMVKKPVLGVIPYFRDIIVDEEDSVFLSKNSFSKGSNQIVIGVIYLPHISNFTDFTPLSLEPDISLFYAQSPEELLNCDCVIIPGSKSTISDAIYLKKKGWFDIIRYLYKKGLTIVGVCGGYQMLGEKIFDPYGIESDIKSMDGLRLLPLITWIEKEKILTRIKFYTKKSEIFPKKIMGKGYEIHMGKTIANGDILPLLDDDQIMRLIVSTDLKVIGTYIHGLFDEDELRCAFINWLRKKKGLELKEKGLSFFSFKEEQFIKLAKIIKDNLDIKRIYEWIS